MRSSYQFTSESVSEGHPDKVSDQISDALVDYFIAKDPEARVACETLVTTQRIVVGGEIRCKPVYDEEKYQDTHGWAPGSRDEIEQVVRQTASTGRRPRSTIICTASRRISPRASMPAATRTKGPETRASCSVSPATRPRT
jgi:S-adenosylmethionine synthetase